jgi:glycosyltransferase involved in cell wall biosynthesis
MKILILLLYYKRPKIVLNALQSIKNSSYDNFELCFIDDSGDESFKETFLSYGIPKDKIKYIPTMDSVEYKEEIGGNRIGKFMNECIKKSDSDISIMLCDDDALTKDYLLNLNIFFTGNQNINYAYSKLLFFEPENESYINARYNYSNLDLPTDYNLNQYNTPIKPNAKLDASQVAWRIKCNVEGNVWFDEVRLMNHDEDFYKKMYYKYGNCYPTNFIGQCKGVSKNQLGNRVRLYKNFFNI